MQLTTVVKLNPTPQQHTALIQTLRACNAVCDRISKTAFDSRTFRKFDLQKLVYHNLKAETGLNANHIIRAIAKVSDAYKLDTKTLRTFLPLGGIELDKDLLTCKVEPQVVSINTVAGRFKIPFVCSAEHKQLLRGKRGQSEQICSACGHCERANRRSQESFCCICCGLKLNADFNASLNLKARGELSAALMFRLDAPASN